MQHLAAAGYRVCVNDISSNQSGLDLLVKEINATHGQGSAIGVIADVTQAEQVQDMIDKTVRELGNLIVMVANAGICQVKPVLEITVKDVQRIFDVNFIGLFNCYTLAAKQMIAQGSSEAGADWPYKIIGAASIVAFKPFPLSSHYSAAKWAVRGFTQVFAMEMAKHRIAVNAYAPGVIGTPLWDQIDEDVSEVAGVPKGQSTDEGAARALMGRIGTPDDVAKVVAGFLAGKDAGFVNGQTIIVDGGIVFS